MDIKYFSPGSLDPDMTKWWKKVSNSVFFFLSIFGFLAYIPGVYLAIIEKQWIIVIIDTAVYSVCIFFAIKKNIPHLIKSIIGTIIFFGLGVFLLFLIGPKGAGVIWLFAATIIAALLLGDFGALVIFILNVLTHIVFYFLILYKVLPWQDELYITTSRWVIQSINFIVLNFIIVMVNSIFISGFRENLHKIKSTRDASIIGLAKLAEYRDHNTGEHLKRLQKYSTMLARELKKLPFYSDYISEEYISDLSISSMLHDIGKVGTPDAILLKSGKLTDEEFKVIQKHPLAGYEVIKEIEGHIEGESLYTMGSEIAYCHHEKWDGSGYPRGISARNIPLSARIVALVDVYDALTTKRSYKIAFTHEKAVELIVDSRGTHFDPEIVDIFIQIADKFI